MHLVFDINFLIIIICLWTSKLPPKRSKTTCLINQRHNRRKEKNRHIRKWRQMWKMTKKQHLSQINMSALRIEKFESYVFHLFRWTEEGYLIGFLKFLAFIIWVGKAIGSVFNYLIPWLEITTTLISKIFILLGLCASSPARNTPMFSL